MRQKLIFNRGQMIRIKINLILNLNLSQHILLSKTRHAKKCFGNNRGLCLVIGKSANCFRQQFV